jgi:hypothetical protein
MNSNNIKFKCIINRCPEKANYNYNTCSNPAYCYIHKTSDMIKFGKYTLDDILCIVFDFF